MTVQACMEIGKHSSCFLYELLAFSKEKHLRPKMLSAAKIVTHQKPSKAQSRNYAWELPTGRRMGSFIRGPE